LILKFFPFNQKPVAASKCASRMPKKFVTSSRIIPRVTIWSEIIFADGAIKFRVVEIPKLRF